MMSVPSPRFRSDKQTKVLSIHHLSLAELLERLEVVPERGLSQEQVEERLSRYGSNTLPMAAPRPTWLRFLDQFKSLLIIVLVVAAALAAVVGNVKDATVIIAVVLFNAALGFYQEHRAEQSLAALRGMLPVKARVRRNGMIAEVLADRLVLGDIVLLEAGDRIPADGRLIQAASLAIDESSLTGESLPVQKDASGIHSWRRDKKLIGQTSPSDSVFPLTVSGGAKETGLQDIRLPLAKDLERCTASG